MKSRSLNSIFGILIIGMIFAVSCEESIDLDLNIQAPRIVVNSHFTSGVPFQLTISKSKDVLSVKPEEFVKNASVKIRDERGKMLEELQLNDSGIPFYQSNRMQPQAGRSYRLEINIPQSPILIAEDIVPIAIPLKKIQLDTVESFSSKEGMFYKIEVQVDFDDPLNTENYYHLSLYNQETIRTEGNGVPMDGFTEQGEENLSPLSPLESHEGNPAVIFHYDNGGVLFTDKDLDGQSIKLKFYSLLDKSNNQTGKVVGELRNVSKAYYLYHTSVSRQIANKDRPFAEPVTIYSNVDNGLGVFAGYALFRDSVFISQ